MMPHQALRILQRKELALGRGRVRAAGGAGALSPPPLRPRVRRAPGRRRRHARALRRARRSALAGAMIPNVSLGESFRGQISMAQFEDLIARHFSRFKTMSEPTRPNKGKEYLKTEASPLARTAFGRRMK